MTNHHRAKNGGNDQYFTHPDDANKLVNLAAKHAPNGATWIEPSAGSGVFLDIMPHARGFDLHPQRADIVQMDWLSPHILTLDAELAHPRVVFGNPPFGMSGSMAVRFFNQSARLKPEVIAFVLPASFAKASMHRKLDWHYSLVEQVMQVMTFSFPDGGTKAVPCVMQVWTRGAARIDPPQDKGVGLPLEFVSKERATMAIRRVGGRAGQVLQGTDHSPETTFFIECSDDVEAKLRSMCFTGTVHHTAGVKSLAKSELCSMIRAGI
jgi:hypothetical protein